MAKGKPRLTSRKGRSSKGQNLRRRPAPVTAEDQNEATQHNPLLEANNQHLEDDVQEPAERPADVNGEDQHEPPQQNLLLKADSQHHEDDVQEPAILISDPAHDARRSSSPQLSQNDTDPLLRSPVKRHSRYIISPDDKFDASATKSPRPNSPKSSVFRPQSQGDNRSASAERQTRDSPRPDNILPAKSLSSNLKRQSRYIISPDDKSDASPTKSPRPNLPKSPVRRAQFQGDARDASAERQSRNSPWPDNTPATKSPSPNLPQSPVVDRVRPQSPAVDRPQSPVVDRLQSPVVDRPQSPVDDLPQSPAVDRPQSPIVDRPQSPVVDRPQSPVVGRPQNPAVNQPQNPAVDRPQSPVVDRPRSPVADRPHPNNGENPHQMEVVNPINDKQTSDDAPPKPGPSKPMFVCEDGKEILTENRKWWGKIIPRDDSDDDNEEFQTSRPSRRPPMRTLMMRNESSALPRDAPDNNLSDQDEPISPRAPPSPPLARDKWINTTIPDRRRVFGRVRDEIMRELEGAHNEMDQHPDFEMHVDEANPEIPIEGNHNEPVIGRQPLIFDNEEDDEPVIVTVPAGERNHQIQLDDDQNQAVIDRRIRDLEEIARIRNGEDPRRRLPSYLRASRPQEAVENYVGQMNQRCPHCGARYFLREKPQRGTYKKCCNDGKVDLPALGAHPEKLKQLFRGANNNTILDNNDADDNDHSISRDFKQNIVTYNNLVAFASVQSEKRQLQGRGPYVYVVQGQIYYKYSNVNVNRGNQTFGPLYTLDPLAAAEQRFNNAGNFNVRRDVLRILSQILHDHNRYAEQYRHLYEEYERQVLQAANQNIQIPQVHLAFLSSRRREFDLPQANEVAAIYQNNQDVRPHPDLKVFLRGEDDGLQTIPSYSQHRDPMAYPLLFPRGDFGWNEDIALHNPQGRRRRVSLLEYYAYRLADRHDDNSFDVFRLAGRLLQHFIVNAYITIETERLNYLRLNQANLRADQYQGLVDYLHNRAEEENVPVGRMIILPSSHQGSPRYQIQRFQDAMAVASAVGNPTFFITMTCNPNWREIREQIPANDQAVNHPLVVDRVFRMKLDALLKEISEGHIFGIVKAVVCVIEFQKRGLPHAHILVTVEDQDRLPDGPSVDRFVSAEIPDPVTQPELYQLVGMHHIHGPCGNLNPNCVCMVDGKCNKHFPKRYNDHTVVGEGRIHYRRRANGRQIQVTRGGRTHVVGNEFVVPYNPYLLLTYRAHINIEVVTGQMYYKYLFKYFFKGDDQALLEIVGGEAGELRYDEIRSYVSGRYMTGPEAAWHILQFPMHFNSHAVYRLPVHLPDRQNVVFRQGQQQERVARVGHTQLTHWFEMNRLYPEARRHLYAEFPLHYTWHPNRHSWAQRRRTNKPLVSRMHTTSLRYGEVYYLRVLLLHVRGATSYEDLRTVNGVVLPTFREACEARGLLHEDLEWRRCLQEASVREMPGRIRRMFAYILVYGTVTNAPDLWTTFRDVMIDDYIHRHHLPQRDAEIRALQGIQRILAHNGRRLNEFGLEEPEEIGDINVVDDPIDVQVERQLGDQMIESLNVEQRAVFDRVIAAVDNEDEVHRLFYVSGAAGTGKTYLYNALITHLYGREQKVISIAWTGLAAALLKNGRTVHSRFQLPVPLLEDSTSGITGQSQGADFIRDAKLVIWDEVSMATRIAFRIIDSTLRYLCGDDRPFGGKCVVVGGDFKQCLPVVPGGHRAEILDACVKTSPLWELFEHIRLETNVRVQQEEIEFVQWLDRLGNGTLPTIPFGAHNDIVQVPEPCVVPTLEALINRVFGRITAGDVPNAAILTPLNDTCFKINDRIVASIHSPHERLYRSSDSVDAADPQDAEAFSVEYLNQFTPSGIPPHRLLLKVGIIVMLLRNLNVRENLCNGTRMVIRHLGVNYIRAEVIDFNGNLSGNEVCIPRIDLKAGPNDILPITMRRRQFPVRPCYAMTINKAQGQTFDKVGIHLPLPVFEHGQLYVAFSRARTAENVSICVEETILQGKLVRGEETTYTKNIVYTEVLQE